MASVDWRLGCMLTRLSEQPAVILTGTVGLSAASEATDGLLIAIVVGIVGLFPVDLDLVLLLAALSSSSEEMSTTIWADIIGWRFLTGS